MTILLILFIVIALALYGVKEYYQIKLDMKPHPTSPEIVRGLVAELAAPESQDDPGGAILHLGSGYGDLVLNLSKQLPAWDIDGVEQNPTLWLISNLRSIGKNMTNYRFFLGDFIKWPLKNYDVVIINQSVKTLQRWEVSIARRLPPGVMVISINASLPHVKPINTVAIDAKNTFHTYEKRVKEVETPPIAENIIEPSYSVDQHSPEFNPPDLPAPQPELPLQAPTPQPD